MGVLVALYLFLGKAIQVGAAEGVVGVDFLEAFASSAVGAVGGGFGGEGG